MFTSLCVCYFFYHPFIQQRMACFQQITRLNFLFRCLRRSTLCTRRYFASSFDKLPPATPGCHANLKVFKFVDKTHLLAKIMNFTATPTFIHAPAMRRIGKTTTIDMLEAMAQGQRDMFEGMAVNADDSPFHIGETNFSVIRLDFSGMKFWSTDPFQFQKIIVDALVYTAKTMYGLDLTSSIDKDAKKEEDVYNPANGFTVLQRKSPRGSADR